MEQARDAFYAVQQRLEELGPYLTPGFTYGEIGAKVGKSEDWVAERSKSIRGALVGEA